MKSIRKDQRSIRAAAEARLAREPPLDPSHPDLPALLHELRVHQIELEMQNEELRRSQAELDEARRRYTDLYEFAPVGYLQLDARASILGANLTASRLLGVDRQGLAGRPLPAFLDEGDADRWHLVRKALLETGAAQSLRVTMKRGNGSKLVAQMECERREGDEAGPKLWVAFTDVTEREAAEAARRESEHQLSLVLSNLREGVNMLDLRTGKYVFMSPSQVAMTGFTEAEIRGMSAEEAADRCHPNDRHISVEQQRAIAAGREDLGTVEYRWKVKSGEYRWFSDSRKVVRDATGQAVALVGVSRDITGQKETEQAAMAREAKLSAYLHSPAAGIVVTENGPNITEVNDAFCNMLGYAREEVLGRSVLAFSHPDDVANSEGVVRRIESGELDSIAWDKRYVHKDGGTVWVLASLTCLRHPDGRPWLGISIEQDITGRKQAEAALRASEARFRALADASPVGIFESDAEGRNVYLNEAAAKIMGLSLEEARGKGWQQAIHPDDRERVYREWDEAVAAKRAYSSQHRFLKPGGVITVLRSFGDAVRNPAGEVTGFVGVIIDVTAEVAMQERLAVTSRLAALGTLVAGVGHEINNPLAAAMANDGAAVADLAELQQRLAMVEAPVRESLAGLVTEIRESVEGALEGDKRVARIVKDLVALGRSGSQRERVRLRDVVDAAVRWLPPAMSREVVVQVVETDPPDVLVNAGQLTQVALNLIANAAKSGSGGKPPRITVRIGPGSPGMARLQVSDDGLGMKPEVMKRIFDPFYSTRETGQGMGLGLSICHVIVTEHGGTITVKSEPGKGSTFTVELPAAPGA